MAGYLNLKLKLRVYSSFGILNMFHFGCMGVSLDLKPTPMVYNSINIPIMNHFSVYGWLCELKTMCKVSIMTNFDCMCVYRT
jgi:hypothetical protein